MVQKKHLGLPHCLQGLQTLLPVVMLLLLHLMLLLLHLMLLQLLLSVLLLRVVLLLLWRRRLLLLLPILLLHVLLVLTILLRSCAHPVLLTRGQCSITTASHLMCSQQHGLPGLWPHLPPYTTMWLSCQPRHAHT
jgi:hypothetical protein